MLFQQVPYTSGGGNTGGHIPAPLQQPQHINNSTNPSCFSSSPLHLVQHSSAPPLHPPPAHQASMSSVRCVQVDIPIMSQGGKFRLQMSNMKLTDELLPPLLAAARTKLLEMYHAQLLHSSSAQLALLTSGPISEQAANDGSPQPELSTTSHLSLGLHPVPSSSAPLAPDIENATLEESFSSLASEPANDTSSRTMAPPPLVTSVPPPAALSAARSHATPAASSPSNSSAASRLRAEAATSGAAQLLSQSATTINAASVTFASTPLIEVTLNRNHLTDASLPAIMDFLLSNPNIESFEMLGNKLTDKAAGHIHALMTRSRLLRIKIGDNMITNEGALVIAEGLRAAHSEFVQLHLGGNPIGDAGIVAVCDACRFCKVEVVGLRDVQIGSTGWAALGRVCFGSRVKELQLKGNSLDAASVGRLLEEATKMSVHSRDTPTTEGPVSVLETLSLANCGLTPETWPDAAAFVGLHPRLTTLDLNNNPISDALVIPLLTCLSNRRLEDGGFLRTLSLQRVRLTPMGLAQLCGSVSDSDEVIRPPLCGLVELDLGFNELGSGATALCADMIRRCRLLKRVSFHRCFLGGPKLVELCSAIAAHPSLTDIDFSSNFSGDDGAVWGNVVQESTRLERLLLTDNQMPSHVTSAIVQSIVQALSTPTSTCKLRQVQIGGQSKVEPLANVVLPSAHASLTQAVSRNRHDHGEGAVGAGVSVSTINSISAHSVATRHHHSVSIPAPHLNTSQTSQLSLNNGGGGSGVFAPSSAVLSAPRLHQAGMLQIPQQAGSVFGHPQPYPQQQQQQHLQGGGHFFAPPLQQSVTFQPSQTWTAAPQHAQQRSSFSYQSSTGSLPMFYQSQPPSPYYVTPPASLTSSSVNFDPNQGAGTATLVGSNQHASGFQHAGGLQQASQAAAPYIDMTTGKMDSFTTVTWPHVGTQVSPPMLFPPGGRLPATPASPSPMYHQLAPQHQPSNQQQHQQAATYVIQTPGPPPSASLAPVNFAATQSFPHSLAPQSGTPVLMTSPSGIPYQTTGVASPQNAPYGAASHYTAIQGSAPGPQSITFAAPSSFTGQWQPYAGGTDPAPPQQILYTSGPINFAPQAAPQSQPQPPQAQSQQPAFIWVSGVNGGAVPVSSSATQGPFVWQQ